jgi:hypothetical protein
VLKLLPVIKFFINYIKKTDFYHPVNIILIKNITKYFLDFFDIYIYISMSYVQNKLRKGWVLLLKAVTGYPFKDNQ